MNLRPRPGLKARRVDGETVLLDRAGGRVHQLNATASFVWSKLDAAQSPEDVIAAVTEAFDVDADTAARDVSALLDQFRSLDLLDPDSRGGD